MIWFLLIVLAAGLLTLAIISQAPKPKKGKKGRYSNRTGMLDRDFVASKWQIILTMSGSGGQLRDAVSEADKLLDYAMKQTGVRGETMGDRLKNSRGRFSDLNSIWEAHKLRNALAHEADFDLVPTQAREALDHFERGLKDLGAL